MPYCLLFATASVKNGKIVLTLNYCNKEVDIIHEACFVKTPKSAAYVASILRNISRYKFAKVKVMGQNGLLFNDQVTLCAFCNGRFYGGASKFHPNQRSKINDSLINMVILPKVNRLFAPYYIYKILRKNLNSCKDVVVKQVKECVITTPAAMNLDGEKKEAAMYHLVVHPKSLNLDI